MSLNTIRANTLGEQTAENDHLNLGANYIETPEYRSILETRDRCVVVGRRGTGKSAMVWKLQQLWSAQKASHVVIVAPEDHHTIGFRALFDIFSARYSHIRAAARLIWKYSLLMEMLLHLSKSFRTRELIPSYIVTQLHVRRWQQDNAPLLAKAISRVGPLLKIQTSADTLIGQLSNILELNQLESDFCELIEKSNVKFYFLIDRLDEGFENDQIGAAIISGAIGTISELNKRHERIRPVLFLRDNVNRSIAKHDPDYTRNVEGEILRIHWDQFQLSNLVCRRLNTAFSLSMENDQRVWDRCTADEGVGRELRGRDGFRKCLQFTLYRPRDLLSLLNQAFYHAAREARDTIVMRDVEHTARAISETRLIDLQKEYSAIFPSIIKSTQCFAGGGPELTCSEALQRLEALSAGNSWAGDIPGQQDYLILQSDGILRALYGVGFIGTHDPGSSTFVFSHDGKSPDREFQASDRILVHPCYWISLNLTRNALTEDQAEQINDEYEIKVTSQSPVIRAARIGKIIADLGHITEGADGAEAFEIWVENAVRTVFAGHLDNIEHKPNGHAVQRRDIVATNLCRSSSFQRINSDYHVRQVIFEVKNYRDIGRDEYRQMSSYLIDKYGTLGFIVTRDEEENLQAGSELDWVRELYLNSDKKLVVRITAKFFLRLLGKLRSPEKYDVVDQALNKLLDQYERTYLSLQSTNARRNKAAKKSK